MTDDRIAQLRLILAGFDSKGEPFDEIQVGDAVAVLMREDTPPVMEIVAETMAFRFHEDYHWDGDGWMTYFGPMAVWRNEDGTSTESPSITKVTPEIIGYWERRARETSHPVLLARYADLVWDFSKRATGEPAHFSMAQLAIDALADTARRRCHRYPTSIIKKLARGLSLACTLNDKERIGTMRDVIIAYEDDVAEDGKPGLWGFSFDLLWGNKRVELSAEQRRRLVGHLEERLQRLSTPDGNGHVDQWGTEAVALRLAVEYRRQGRSEDIHRVLGAFGRAFEKAAEAGETMAKNDQLNLALPSLILELGMVLNETSGGGRSVAGRNGNERPSPEQADAMVARIVIRT